MNTVIAIARQFDEAVTGIAPLGNGLINDTFLVNTSSDAFVLQRINPQVFPNPRLIMDNLAVLGQHLEKKSSPSPLKIPVALKLTANQPYYQDEQGGFWRALSFIANTESLETLQTIQQAEQTGWALGQFHYLVSDLDPSLLHDTLPGFHITPDYLRQYHQVLKTSDIPQNAYCAEFIAQFEQNADALEIAQQNGLLKLRVIHGDPKLNNFLFDQHAQTIVSLIDLDTVKPGLVHYDIGDCLRSCCHNPVDDRFDLAICKALLSSYLSVADAFFTAADYQYLYAAIRLIPFELGLRFYTDYLQGNCYFKISSPLQNLHRAAAQFLLCRSIMNQEVAIHALIAEHSKGAMTDGFTG